MKICENENCKAVIKECSNFCHICGTKVKKCDFNFIPKVYQNINGYWKVTTEGDCEGKTTKYLGKFYGSISDIAKKLAHKSYYSLQFDPAKELEEIVPSDKDIKEVHVSFGNDSKTWNLNSEDRAKIIENMFKAAGINNIEIAPSNYYASFRILYK